MPVGADTAREKFWITTYSDASERERDERIKFLFNEINLRCSFEFLPSLLLPACLPAVRQ